MNPFVLAALVIGLAIVIFIMYRSKKMADYQQAEMKRILDRMGPLFEKVDSGAITAADVLPYIEDLRTRKHTYNLLHDAKRLELIPESYMTFEKAAAGQLAAWLEFPTELGTVPDEIEHLERVSFDFDGNGENWVHYEVFRFRMKEPHANAKEGWQLGVVGPYFDDSKAYSNAGATFSRFMKEAETTPEAEATWVHNMSKHKAD